MPSPTVCPKCGSQDYVDEEELPLLPIGSQVEMKPMDDTLRAWYNKIKKFIPKGEV